MLRPAPQSRALRLARTHTELLVSTCVDTGVVLTQSDLTEFMQALSLVLVCIAANALDGLISDPQARQQDDSSRSVPHNP
jgi:hypothetical protein